MGTAIENAATYAFLYASILDIYSSLVLQNNAEPDKVPKKFTRIIMHTA
jgi:hypothetical protein